MTVLAMRTRFQPGEIIRAPQPRLRKSLVEIVDWPYLDGGEGALPFPVGADL